MRNSYVIRKANSTIPEFRIYDRNEIRETTISKIAGGGYDEAGTSEKELDQERNVVPRKGENITIVGDLIIKKDDNKPTDWEIENGEERKAILKMYKEFLKDSKRACRVKFVDYRRYVSVESKQKSTYYLETFLDKLREKYSALDGKAHMDFLILNSGFSQFLEDYAVNHHIFYGEVSIEVEEILRVEKFLIRKEKIRSALRR